MTCEASSEPLDSHKSLFYSSKERMGDDIVLPGQVQAEKEEILKVYKPSENEISILRRLSSSCGDDCDENDHLPAMPVTSAKSQRIISSSEMEAPLNRRFLSSKELTAVERRSTTGSVDPKQLSLREIKFRSSFRAIPDATTSRKFSESALRYDSRALLSLSLAKNEENDDGTDSEEGDCEAPLQEKSNEGGSSSGRSCELPALTQKNLSNSVITPDVAMGGLSGQRKLSISSSNTSVGIPLSGGNSPLPDSSQPSDKVDKNDNYPPTDIISKKNSETRQSESSVIDDDDGETNMQGLAPLPEQKLTPKMEPHPPRAKSFKGQISLKTRAAIKRSNSVQSGQPQATEEGVAEGTRRPSFVPRILVSKQASKESVVSKSSDTSSSKESNSGANPKKYSSMRGGNRISLKTKAALKRSHGAGSSQALDE